MTRELTARQLNRATLHRQLLLARPRVPVVEAVRRIVAIQAQEPASPYVALWNRVDDFDAADLDAAFAHGDVVKATLMRITLHAVAAEDHGPFRAAMLPNLRASRLNDARFRATGLTPADVDDLLLDLTAFAAAPRTKDDIERRISELLRAPADPGVWWALRSIAPLVHAPTGGPWTFGLRPSFLAASTPTFGGDQQAALHHLVWRYLEGFGPATAADFAQFALQKRTVARAAFDAMSEHLVTYDGPDGRRLHDVPAGEVPADDTPAPARLLPMWDSTLLAYDDRRRMIPEEHRRIVIRRNGDVLPTVLVDGVVAGVWRPVDGRIEVRSFTPLPDREWEALSGEAARLLAFLESRDRAVYRRYGRWWPELPGGLDRVVLS